MVFEDSSPYGVHVGGGAAALRQVGAINPGQVVVSADALVFTGGSSYGLDATGGVLAYLQEMGRGTLVGRMRVPAVPSAALFDLFVGDGNVRPNAEMGRQAVAVAVENSVVEGRFGAGAGATVGKLFGISRASWGGIGVATVDLGGGLFVSALAAVNSFGNVMDPETLEFIAGARELDGGFIDIEDAVMAGLPRSSAENGGNTTLSLVVTNGRLDSKQAGRAAGLSAQAVPMCVRPSWTDFDGDVTFVVATGQVPAEPHQIGLAGRAALERALVRGPRTSNAGGLFPADFPGGLQ